MINKVLTGIVVFLLLIFTTIATVSLSQFPVGNYIPILATPTVDCAPIVERYKRDVLKSRLAEVIDAIDLMSKTPRVALPAQIADFQKMRREISDDVPNGCAMDLHNRLMKALNNANDGFMAFMANDDNIDVSLPLRLALDDLSVLADEIK